MSEELEQCAVIQWSLMYDKLEWLHAIPNGGLRNKKVASKLKKSGVKAGVHDLFLPVVKPPYHGMYIEMKYGDNKLTKKQIEFKEHCESQGYKSVTCYTAGEAIREIQDYMRMK